MPFGLRDALEPLLPRAIVWAEAQSHIASTKGEGLNELLSKVATSVGVLRHDLIRVYTVESIPFPEDRDLREAALLMGLLGPGVEALTLGYSIFVHRGSESLRLLSHEFRHVQQYEAHAGIAGFLPLYLQQIVDFGYDCAPFEVEARNYEVPA